MNCAGSPGTVRYPRLTGLSAPPRWGRFLGSGQGFGPATGPALQAPVLQTVARGFWPFRFKFMNARADRRLADVKSIRGTDKVARCNNREEGSGQFGVHWHVPLISIIQISSVDIIRLSKVIYSIDFDLSIRLYVAGPKSVRSASPR